MNRGCFFGFRRIIKDKVISAMKGVMGLGVNGGLIEPSDRTSEIRRAKWLIAPTARFHGEYFIRRYASSANCPASSCI